MKSKWSFSLISLVVVLSLAILLFGFSDRLKANPIDSYVVYLDGQKIGAIKSEEEFDDYINEKEQSIRNVYEVDTIYPPKGVEIRKETTYNDDVSTDEEIYNKITESKNFSIKGVKVTIDNEDEEAEDIVINVLSKEIFDEALENTIKAFVDSEQYQSFLNGAQAEIEDTGRIIENIDIKEKVTYRTDLINVDEKIFTDVDELSKYLLYGTLEKQATYTVKEGDTIEEVAANNKLNVAEFLIANPQFNSENNLLYESQEVVVGLIDPIISVVVEYHSVEEEERPYEVEIKYDETQLKGYEKVERQGENGLYSVTRKYQYVNGQLEDTVTVSSTELKPAVNEVLVKGDKYVPEVADLSYWAWPTNRPYVITTDYEYRWGSFHSAIDIAGTGYGSDIYAANNGVVYEAKGGCSPGYSGCNGGRGNYIIINHNAGGYYSQYMHLASIDVSVGQTVARGQHIAKMGNTGYVVPSPSSYSPYAGTHLDFSIYIGVPYRGGYTINPLGLY